MFTFLRKDQTFREFLTAEIKAGEVWANNMRNAVAVDADRGGSLWEIIQNCVAAYHADELQSYMKDLLAAYDECERRAHRFEPGQTYAVNSTERMEPVNLLDFDDPRPQRR